MHDVRRAPPRILEAELAARVSIDRDAIAFLNHILALGALALLAGGAYYLAARLGTDFRFLNSPIGVVWPANAVLLAALLLTARRHWWLMALAAGVAHAAAMGPTAEAWRWGWQIIVNTAFATVTAALLQQIAGLPLRFATRRQVLVFAGITFAASAAFALALPVFVRTALGLETQFTPAASLLRATLTNATPILLIVPVVVLWAQYGARRITELPLLRLVEAAGVIVSVVGVGVLAFDGGLDVTNYPSLLAWIFPPLLWAAVRFGPLGGSTAVFCVAALSMGGTARQLGPFVHVADAEKVLSLHLYWIVLWPPVMLLAACMREHEDTEAALHAQRNQLAHVTRVATVGELSGALAHELRQPLMAILANAQAGIRILAREPLDTPELREILQDIAQQDKQAASVISRVRSFLTQREAEFEPLAVESVVRDALALGRSAVETSGVDVQAHIPTNLPRVRGDPVQLLQIMLNLVVNGCESMTDVPQPERRLRLHVARMDPAHLEVQIADNGVGLPSGDVDGIFQPFFTTKTKGLGLGLSISRSIATAHGGRLWAENNAHRGATFHLVLPTDTEHAERTSDRRHR